MLCIYAYIIKCLFSADMNNNNNNNDNDNNDDNNNNNNNNNVSPTNETYLTPGYY